MTRLEQLKQTWVSGQTNTPVLQQQIWDRAAERDGGLPIPDFETDAFLRELDRAIFLDKTMRILDIGCGSGVYSMALAPRVAQAVGVDISPNMIACANDRSQTLGLDNTQFQCLDWAGADIDALGFRGGFDVVFAHMTPAVADYNTFEKLCACSRGLCLMEKPARRRDMVQDEAFRLVGIDSREGQDGILQAFTYLWCMGCCPQLSYHDEVWDTRRTTEDMVAWCTNRAKLHKSLTEAQEKSIRDYVERQATGGMVLERTSTTRVTMLWRLSTYQK